MGPRNWRRRDGRIHEGVCERLTANARLEASEMEVEAREGQFVRMGFVDSRREKYLAEEEAESGLGARVIDNP